MALASLALGYARRLHVALGLALALAGVGAIGVAAQPVGGATESLELFAEMMPVLSHPRCTNCHGGVTVMDGVLDGQKHGGGEVSDVPLNPQGDMLPGTQSNEQCLECHDEAPPNGQPQVWRLAPRHMSLVGKDTVTLCQQMRTLNGLGASAQAANERFIDHLGGDQLIGFAFEGRRGGAMLPEHSPEPPPMTQLEFVAAASRWINAGQAKCGTGWTGSIVQKTTLRSNSPGSILSTDSTRSTWHPRKTSSSVSRMGRPGCSCTPTLAATAPGTSSGSLSGARSATQTPSRNSGRSNTAAATASARRVLPLPPGPVRVNSPQPSWSKCSRMVPRACSRPTIEGRCTGTLFSRSAAAAETLITANPGCCHARTTYLVCQAATNRWV